MNNHYAETSAIVDAVASSAEAPSMAQRIAALARRFFHGSAKARAVPAAVVLPTGSDVHEVHCASQGEAEQCSLRHIGQGYTARVVQDPYDYSWSVTVSLPASPATPA